MYKYMSYFRTDSTNSRRRYDGSRRRVRKLIGNRRTWYPKSAEEAALRRVLARLKDEQGLVPFSTAENHRKGLIRELLSENNFLHLN
tara:strand:+ start:23 stop:283 length:261 start_codon:yes stop_codon:yes gene_type:complete